MVAQMTLPSSDPADAAALREQAREWFVRLLQRPSRANRKGCETWRAQSAEHDEAYRQVEQNWEASLDIGRKLAGEEAAELDGYLRQMDERKAKRRTRAAGATAILVGGVMLASGYAWLEYPHLLDNLRADHVTARGERQTVALADGSTVLLDADSAIDVQFGDGTRRVRLLHGAAFFEVATTGEPFVVDTDEAEVTVLGTGFAVREGNGVETVTLEHGSVQVANASGHSEVLMPGQQAVLQPDGAIAVAAVELADELAWRDGRYVFYRARLADVLEQIERYGGGRAVFLDPAIGDLRVTGSLPLDDPQGALASLQASTGVSFTGLGPLTFATR